MLQSVQAVLEALAARRMSLAVAEGDTGGVLLDVLTAVAGSSAVVRGGVVAYHDDLKRQVLGVAAEVLVGHGAVSAEVALAMAEGVRRLAGADLGLATTGVRRRRQCRAVARAPPPVARRPSDQPRRQRRSRAPPRARAARMNQAKGQRENRRHSRTFVLSSN